MATLPLDDIVNIIVNLSPRSAIRKGFNLGLIIGSSDVISSSNRVKIYSSLDAMSEDGFTDNMPEYMAASLYFSQPKKPSRVAIGRHVKTVGLSEIDIMAINTETDKFKVEINSGLGYGNKYVYKTASTSISLPEYGKELSSGWTEVANNEEITATDGHLIMVCEVDANNKALKAGKATVGGESILLGLPKGETVVEAVRACRSKNTDWYAMTYCGANIEDIKNIARYIETATPSSVYFFTSNQPEFLNSLDNVFSYLKGLNLMRSLGQYSLTADAVAGIMGYAMGANTKTSNSAYTLMHKSVTGILPDNLNATQIDYLTKSNANYYVSRGSGGDYTLFENGVMANGTWFDEVINLDMLVNDMQLAIFDLLKSRPKIAQTEAGMNDIKLAIKPALNKMRLVGFIAPGKWNGPDIWLTEDHCPLATGDMLSDGYLILSEPIDNQSQADRDARKAPNIYTPIKLAGAIHTVLVQIDVNR